jgi:hypothetical protein
MTGAVMFAPRRANRRFRLRTEDYMPRHFGLKATSGDPKTVTATAPILVKTLNATTSVQNTPPQVSSAAAASLRFISVDRDQPEVEAVDRGRPAD